jgi:outer membrane protein insertion porin family/translocation and assembly module TamA
LIFCPILPLLTAMPGFFAPLLRRFAAWLALAFMLALFTGARAQFPLEDYQRWQNYNGWRIWVIEFPGIHAFARGELMTVMATEHPLWMRRYARIGRRTMFYADDFAADLFRLRNFYRREGFRTAAVTGYVIPNETKQEVKLKIEVSEGPPLVLESWRMIFGSDSGAGVDSARWSGSLAIKVGKRLALSDVRRSADTLAHKLRIIGHARARVEFEVETDSLRNTARVTFVLYPGHFCRFGPTRITGLKQVSEGTARRELTYRKFEPFSPVKLEATRRNLVRLETFTQVNLRPDTASPGDTIPIWIRIEEGARYHVRVGGGYDSEVRTHTAAEFTDLNFFGRGRRFTWSGSYAEIRRRTEARLFWPHTPLHATDITLAPKWELEIKPGFTLETLTATTILSAAPLELVNVSIANEVGRARRTDRDTSITAPDYAKNYLKSVESFSVGWDTRDHPLVPRKGHFLGMTLAESGLFYRTDLRWWRALFSGRALYPANRLTILAGKTELGVMGPLHEAPQTPIEERFYLGGPTTVRGWRQDHLSPRATGAERTPTGGDFSFSMTAEVRYNLWGMLSTAVFCDAGNVWERPRLWRPVDLYPSGGLGLLLTTPVGPVRLDYAHQLRAYKYTEKKWAIHLTLGTPF